MGAEVVIEPVPVPVAAVPGVVPVAAAPGGVPVPVAAGASAPVAVCRTGVGAEVVIEPVPVPVPVAEATGGAADGAKDAAFACRENPSRTAKIPAAKIATCIARRAICRKIGWGTSSSRPVG